jgi:hypothetical protein
MTRQYKKGHGWFMANNDGSVDVLGCGIPLRQREQSQFAFGGGVR